LFGRPERLSSSTDTRLALKCECHSETTALFKECFPKVADLPSFMQNCMQTHCTILPSIADKTKHKVEKALM
jgi:hypothetical protein